MRPHGGGDLESLTPREVQIALLVAEGRTTREVASSLFLSPKTIEYHLRHVYTKLGIVSRAELIGRVRADQDQARPGGIGGTSAATGSR